jgi:hypothetical protein
MKCVSIKLRNEVFRDMEDIRRTVKVSRNAYIARALVLYNQLHKRQLRQGRLRRESRAFAKLQRYGAARACAQGVVTEADVDAAVFQDR